MPNEPNAAQALYGHLPSGAREPVAQSARSLAEVMYPTLPSNSPEAKAKERVSAEQQRQKKFYRDLLLRNLREANANIDKRRSR